MMPEQIGIVLLVLVVVLFNLITGFLNRRRERAAADKDKKVPQPAPPSRRAPPRVVMTPPRFDMSPPATTPGQRRRRAHFGRGDLRRAIVVMTLLGPPRALVEEGRDVTR